MTRKDRVLVPSKRLSALDIRDAHTVKAHLERRLYQKLFETSAFHVYFLVDVRLVAPK